MSGPSVAIVLNVHREAEYVAKTLMSLAIAVDCAVRSGVEIEMVVVFDRSDSSTVDAVNAGTETFPCRLKFITVDNGNLALSRNDGIDAADGEFILTADADDLVSANLIAAMRQALQQDPDASLVFPAYFIAFGDANFVFRLHGSRDVSALALLDSHPFMSRAMFRREVFAGNRFVATLPIAPYHFEDWHWNCECLAAGRVSIVAEGAAIYYRQRKGSLMHEARKQGRFQIAPSRMFVPEVFCRIAERDYAELLAERREALDYSGIWRDLMSFRDDMVYQSRFEPQLKADLTLSTPVYDSRFASSLEVGACYYEICKLLANQTFCHVFLLPFHVSGGAELFVRALLEAIYEVSPKENILAILGEATTSASHEVELPANVTTINLGRDWPQLTLDDRCTIALKLIQSTAPKAYVHVRESPFGNAFLDLYRSLLVDNKLVLYPFALSRPLRSSRQRRKRISTAYVDRNVDAAIYLITDNQSVISEYTRTRCVSQPDPKWRCVRAPHAMAVTAAEIEERRRRFSTSSVRKVLWASRITESKRPSLVSKIAKLIARRGLQCEIDMYGSSDFSDPRAVERLTQGASYRGEYEQFGALATSEYVCFIYTSIYDGMPNVVLEAACHGIPIIAPDIGGVSEFVAHRVTGLLLPSSSNDDDMAARYADAIQILLEDPDLGQSLALGARARILEMFSVSQHRETLRDLFFRRGEPQGGEPAMSLDATHPEARPPRPEATASTAENHEGQALELARRQAAIEALEAKNIELRRTLQIERERFVAPDARMRHDGRVSLADGEISLEGRKLPVKAFRRIAKIWNRPAKRLALRIVLRIMGASV